MTLETTVHSYTGRIQFIKFHEFRLWRSWWKVTYVMSVRTYVRKCLKICYQYTSKKLYFSGVVVYRPETVFMIEVILTYYFAKYDKFNCKLYVYMWYLIVLIVIYYENIPVSFNSGKLGIILRLNPFSN